jgi:hypothetical protein
MVTGTGVIGLMEEISKKSHIKANGKRITGDAVIDRALWRLSLVLKEIAESTNNQEPTVTDNPKPPSGRGNRKALQSKVGR